MKTGWVNDNETEIPRTSFAERIGSLANAVKNALPGLPATRSPSPWQGGHDAFYETGMTNPHAAGSAAHQAWREGYDAARDAFEW